ncbi:MAG TPA: hypothetical protein VKE74_00955 [Gemmataceae bacterium]|nr:hypothetical protein [Gemmataceae bacterium]
MSLPASGDPWVVYGYEVEMFGGMCRLLEVGNAEYAALPPQVQNAVVESALLHTRQLADILLSRGKGQSRGEDQDDIYLSDLLPDFMPSRFDELKAAYGKRNDEGSACRTINKHFAHPTTHRRASFDYAPLLMQLVPIIADIIQEVDEYRKRPN